jgi:hypothetical protein
MTTAKKKTRYVLILLNHKNKKYISILVNYTHNFLIRFFFQEHTIQELH